ncbi:DNA mismatch repair protein [Nocardia sp. NPDC048505]|uniref:MutS-related protein n=1 Tax=unclassified Nocardia TaxID=2637762 RepID=UPI0033C8ACDE
MRVNLLHPPDRISATAPTGDHAVTDLGLESVFAAMSGPDPLIGQVVQATVLAPITDPAVIGYRQAVLTDCLTHPSAIRELYRIAVMPTQIRRWPVANGRRPGGKLVLSLPAFGELLGCLRRLRAHCRDHATDFSSAGLRALVDTVTDHFDDAYLDTIETHLTAVQFEHGLHLGAGLGLGNKIADIVVHEPLTPWRGRFGSDRRAMRAFRPIEDPEARFNPQLNPIVELRDRALGDLAAVVSYAVDHIHGFFERLRTELAFYLGCLNLHEHLTAAGIPTCLPTVHPAGTNTLRCNGLRDITLCLSARGEVVGNDLDATGRTLLVVTGANNGGKSTFLRSVGAAQVMMQAGMFVVAERFEATVRTGIFTHFVTDEDRTMTYGKLVEELVRMRAVVDRIGPGSLLLSNESFASTSEGDAARILTPLVEALLDSSVQLVLVTHLYEFADRRHRGAHPGDLFLRAGRRPDGRRTFRLVAGAPEPSSHAEEIFRQVFPEDQP